MSKFPGYSAVSSMATRYPSIATPAAYASSYPYSVIAPEYRDLVVDGKRLEDHSPKELVLAYHGTQDLNLKRILEPSNEVLGRLGAASLEERRLAGQRKKGRCGMPKRTVAAIMKRGISDPADIFGEMTKQGFQIDDAEQRFTYADRGHNGKVSFERVRNIIRELKRPTA